MANKMKALKSFPRLRAGYVLFSLVVCLLAFSSAEAASQKLVPDDTISGATRWDVLPACGGGNCRVTYITDAVDANYLWSLAANSQRYSFTNTSGIPGTATIDSFKLWLRASVNNAGGLDRINLQIRKTGSAHTCDITPIGLETTAFADSPRVSISWPTAAATCTDGVLSIARMDSLEFLFNDVGDTNKITACSVIVFYTEAGGATKARRRKLSIDEGGYEKFAEFCGLDPNWVVGFREPEFIWREE